MSLKNAHSKMLSVKRYVNSIILEREAETDSALIAILSGASCFYLGDAGAAKTAHVSLLGSLMGLTLFDILMSETTKPEQIFGPVDVPALAKGTQRIKTKGYAADSQLLFLDEIFKANAVVLNPLLGLLNEHTFRNGDEGVLSCPIVTVFAASNEIPTDKASRPMYDRFLIRPEVEYIKSNTNLHKLREIAMGLRKREEPEHMTFEEVEILRKAVKRVEFPSDVWETMLTIRNQVKQGCKVEISDRRLAKKLKAPQLTSLPMFIEHDLKKPPAYTTPDGIWIRTDIYHQFPWEAEFYVCHEIGHHVVMSPSETGTFHPTIVNYAEDYQIHEFMFSKLGYDARTASIRGLFNRKYGRQNVVKTCEELTAKNEYPSGTPCGCRTIASPIIEAVAQTIRTNFNVNNTSHRTIVTDQMDDEKYVAEIHPQVRYQARLNTIPTRIADLTHSLFHYAFSETPTAEPHGSTLTYGEILTFAISPTIRRKTEGNTDNSVIFVLTYLKMLDAHQRLLNQLVYNAMKTVDKYEKLLVNHNQHSKRYTKTWLKKKDNLIDRVASAKALLNRRKRLALRPLPIMLKETPVLVRKMTFIPPKTLKTSIRRTPIVLPGLPVLKHNEVTRTVAYLSRIAETRSKTLIELKEELEKNLGPLTPTDNEEGEPIEAEGVGSNQSGADKQDGKGNGVAPLMADLPAKDLKLLQAILSHMQEFDTVLSTKRKPKADENSLEYPSIPSIGSNLSAIDMQELALLANEETKMLFYVKLADGSLAIRMPQEAKRSPVALWIDASGSMQGKGYALACGFALSMLKKLHQDKRGVLFGIFSHNITCELVFDKDVTIDLPTIIKSLLKPKYGGTNFDAAMAKTYEVKERMQWKGLSTLLVTDGDGSISDNVVNMLSQKKTSDDRITMVNVSKSSASGLRGMVDELYHVDADDLQATLTKAGNKLL